MLINNQYSRGISVYDGNSKSNNSNMSTEIPFADKLKETLSESEAKEFQPTDSIGVIVRQMKISGEESKQVEHNGVKISVSCEEGKGTEITIGDEDPNGNWQSIKTKDGVVHINLSDPASIMKCLDLFSPEEVKQIMMMLALEKKVQEMEESVAETEEEVLEAVNQIPEA